MVSPRSSLERLTKSRDLDAIKNWGAASIQGTPPEEALKWATAELKKIYAG